MATVAPARKKNIITEAWRLHLAAGRAEKRAPAKAPDPQPVVKKPTKGKGRAK